MSKIIKTCQCGNSFQTTTQRIDDGRGKFCSQACKYKYKVKRKSGKGSYKLVKENPTWFKKGSIPWSAGTVGILKAWNKGTKGIMSANITSFKKNDNLSESNNNWKGDKVSYFNLHAWVYRHKGKACKCEKCGCEDKVQWANKSHEYKRDLDDWLELCYWCHRKYDSGKNWGSIKKFYNEKLKRIV